MPSRALAALAGEPLKNTLTISPSADFARRVSESTGLYRKPRSDSLRCDEALVLEPLEHRPHRRAAELVGQRIADLGDEHRPAFIEDVDDLSFAGRELAEHAQILFERAESPRYICSRATFVAPNARCHCRSDSPSSLADGVGFEPTDACTSPVFKTGALNRSATHPSELGRALSRVGTGCARRGVNQAGRMGVYQTSLRCWEEGVLSTIEFMGLGCGVGRLGRVIGRSRFRSSVEPATVLPHRPRLRNPPRTAGTCTRRGSPRSRGIRECANRRSGPTSRDF